MSEYASLLRALDARRDLEAGAMAGAIGSMMDGVWNDEQMAGFLTALAAKGAIVDELVGAAEAMRARSLRVEHSLRTVVDTCGTGGDGAHTINISTAAAFVIAGTGLPVAKHGNRAASSRCGSADVLEACGIALDSTPEAARAALEKTNFTFMFAQAYHPSMKAVGPVRKRLGMRTVFNLLGPLTNPAGATSQVIGVSEPAHLELMGAALERLGGRAGAIVHSSSGLDEIGGDAPTDVYQFGRASVRRWRLDPAEFDVRASLEDLAGGSPAENAAALRSILEGERSPRSEVVALNAALALLVAEHVESLLEGLLRARTSLSDGSARAVFDAARAPRKQKMEIA